MDTKHDQDILDGRAYVRLIEATAILLKTSLMARDRYILERATEVAKTNLRELVARLPPHVTAQILAIGENIIGPVGESTQN